MNQLNPFIQSTTRVSELERCMGGTPSGLVGGPVPQREKYIVGAMSRLGKTVTEVHDLSLKLREHLSPLLRNELANPKEVDPVPKRAPETQLSDAIHTNIEGIESAIAVLRNVIERLEM